MKVGNKIASSSPAPVDAGSQSAAAKTAPSASQSQKLDAFEAKSSGGASDAAPSGSAAISVFGTPLTVGRLPPLIEALEDGSIEPLSPARMQIPEAALECLEQAERIVITGHVPPDADCVGSAVGLARLLRALGKHADVCIDGKLSGVERGLIREGEVERFSDLEERNYDLVVLVDVSDTERIGDASGLLQKGADILVVDHHNTKVSGETFGVPSDEVHAWIAKDAASASLLVSGIAEQLAQRTSSELSEDDWTSVMLPLAAGMLTDTGWFKYDGLAMEALRTFKHLWSEHLSEDLDAISATVTYELPETAAGLLEQPPVIRGALAKPEAADLRQRWEALEETGEHLQRTMVGDYGLIVSVPNAAFDVLVAAAQLEDPLAGPMEISQALLDDVNAALKTRDVGVLIKDLDKVSLSIRSRDAGPALELASSLGGGGHPRAAGARSKVGREETLELVRNWMEKKELERHASVHRLGSV